MQPAQEQPEQERGPLEVAAASIINKRPASACSGSNAAPSNIVTLVVSPLNLAAITNKTTNEKNREPTVSASAPATASATTSAPSCKKQPRSRSRSQSHSPTSPTLKTHHPHLTPTLPDTMADGAGNQKPSVGDTSGEGGLPFYEAQRKSLQKLMDKKRKLAERLAQREERIEQKETEYLESTPAGNILTGFDNYTKGTTQAAAAQRRKTGPLEQHRVFSRSSISYNPNNSASDSATTPGSSHAPTPISTTFGGSNHPTPTSAGGPNRPSGTQRDRKKKAVAASADAGDSESDAKEVKKVRTNFGASRK